MKLRLCYGDENEEKDRFIVVFPATEYRLNEYSERIGQSCSLLGYEFTFLKGEEVEFSRRLKQSLFKCLKIRQWDIHYIEHLAEQIQVIESCTEWRTVLKANCKRAEYKNLFQLLAETIRCIDDVKIPEFLKYSFEELEAEDRSEMKTDVFKNIK